MSIFTQASMSRPSYNTFNLSHDREFTTKFGLLTPIGLIDTIPGDVFTIKTTQIIRLAPLVAPIMGRIDAYVHWFFVPNRLVWDEWEDFITGGPDGTLEPLVPRISVPLSNSSLADYFNVHGSGLSGGQTIHVSAIPFAAYHKIYNEFFRDQNLTTEDPDTVVSGINGGPSAGILLSLRYRAWKKDYFTSALPWEQRGPEVTIPLEGTAPLQDANPGARSIQYTPIGAPDDVWDVAGQVLSQSRPVDSGPSGWLTDNSATDTQPLSIDNSEHLSLNIAKYEADLSAASATTIRSFRNAIKLQEFLEKMARGGSRYAEVNRSIFGVPIEDARLQRPEYLGGGKTPVTVSEVLQTSSTDETSPQGNMSGHAISVGGMKPFSYRCKEHGYIMGLISIMPKAQYTQGIPRHFSRESRYDYFWPQFQHIGEQGIKVKEIYAQGTGNDDDIWGYTPRYAEYKFQLSSVHGDFRDTLDFWTMARLFQTEPTLSNNFVNSIGGVRTDIFAVDDGTDYFWVHLYNDVKAKRPMAYFGSPKL